MSESLEVALLLRWCDLTLAGLAESREQIDALNVYPVPDRDTGTNLHLTFEAARQALVEAKTDSLVLALTVFAKGALLGARGNSGVILSQLLRAGADQLLRGDPSKPGQLLADTLTLASNAAYAAVARPVEGTMLTVARAAARAATDAVPHGPADPTQQMGFVVTAAARAAHTALDATTEQLETLRRAGVVDAGGLGLCVLFDAAQSALTGTESPSWQHSAHIPAHWPPGPVHLAGEIGLAGTGPAFEVMYLLDAPEPHIARLKERLEPLGDSLVVVGGDDLWNVHVHVDDVGAAIEAGIEAGRPHRIRVTHFDERAAQQYCGPVRGPDGGGGGGRRSGARSPVPRRGC
ncbi:MAG: DAK2 domain-containing protein [Nocardioidaceae bacterium]